MTTTTTTATTIDTKNNTFTNFSLSAEQINFFHENGYLIIENYYTLDTCNILSHAMHRIVTGFSPDEHTSIFTTKEQERTSDDYFLTSGDKIRYFLEPGALNTDKSLIGPLATSINKIGHNLHGLDPDFANATFTPQAISICKSLGYIEPSIAQSMFIFKQPYIGGEVSPHTDGTFLRTTPQSVLGFWIPLEKCTQSNGCLWAVPGSHKHPIKRIFRRREDGQGTEFIPPTAEEYDTSGGVALEMNPGSLLLIHHSLVHWSNANTSPLSRHAYTFHVIDTSENFIYGKDNWLQYENNNPFQYLYTK
jgi:phytanoyl-CoA hydroxylase